MTGEPNVRVSASSRSILSSRAGKYGVPVVGGGLVPGWAVVGGRATYEAAAHWGDKNPWGVPFFIVTHRPEEEPKDGEFTFVSGVEAAVERALRSAGDKDAHIMGGAEIIRQALEAGIVDEPSIIVAPVVLGGGKRLFEGFSRSLDLEHLGVRQSPFATFIDYRVA